MDTTVAKLLESYFHPPQEILRTTVNNMAVVTIHSERSIVGYTTKLYVGGFVAKEKLAEDLKTALDNHLEFQTDVVREYTKTILQMTKQ